MVKSAKSEHWRAEPDEHDYPAAVDYLSLVLTPAEAAAVGAALASAPLIHRKAKDILRASSLRVLPADNAEVHRDLEKVRQGTKLSPVLLVRGHLRTGVGLVVADGYHRICASYHLDESAEIPCRIVDLPGPA